MIQSHVECYKTDNGVISQINKYTRDKTKYAIINFNNQLGADEKRYLATRKSKYPCGIPMSVTVNNNIKSCMLRLNKSGAKKKITHVTTLKSTNNISWYLLYLSSCE